MEKSATVKLYDEIRNGAHMGIDAIDEMLRRCNDRAFSEELSDMQRAYKQIAQEAADAIIREGDIPEELSAEARLGLHLSTKTRLAFSKDKEKTMSTMILKGMEMAQKEIHRDAAAYQNASDDAHALADRLLKVQERYRTYFESRR